MPTYYWIFDPFFPSPPQFTRRMTEFLSEKFWDAIEERQNELIARLDALNASIEATLAEFDKPPAPAPQQEAA